MPAAQSTQATVELLQERSRDALIERLDAAVEGLEHDELLDFVADLLLTLGADRDQLKDRVVQLLTSRYGRSSEKSSEEQLQLFSKILRVVQEPATDEGGESSSPEEEPGPTPAETAASLIEQTNADIAAEKAEQRRRKDEEREARRQAMELERSDGSESTPWPDHLPVEHVYLDVPEDLASEEHEVIRHETSWRLERETQVKVVVTHSPVLARRDHVGGPISLPVPPKPVDKGRLGFSLAAYILWLRTVHNLPVRRIVEMLVAEGAPVSESMVHTLITTTGKRAKPLVEAIHRKVQGADLVNLDDTHTDVHEGQRKRKRRRARVWLALGDEEFAFFFATRTWKAAEAEEVLGAIRGTLQGDGYRGFPRYADKLDIDLAGCMAHLRRKLREALKAGDPRAAEALALVQGLYRVEELARLRHLDAEQRLALRQERSVPIMHALVEWAHVVQPTIVKGSPLGKAWLYLSNQLERLQVFLSNGTVSIDNNAAERGLRRVTIGRKLWLFFRGQAKLEHVTRLMSIVVTARLHSVDELAYLTWVLEELARREWSPEAAIRLLPDAWLAMQQEKAEELGAGEG